MLGRQLSFKAGSSKRGNDLLGASEDYLSVISINPSTDDPDDPNSKEIRISCADAQGLACDLSRVLLDFGLRIVRGDISTDGRWCGVVMAVTLSEGARPRWSLLRRRLEALLPQGADTVLLAPRSESLHSSSASIFMLQITSSDRPGMLHGMVDSLWEAELTVHKAHITTSPGNDVADMFWISDMTGRLPRDDRAQEIIARIREALQQPSATVLVLPSSWDDLELKAGIKTTNICAKATNPLRKVKGRHHRSASVACAAAVREGLLASGQVLEDGFCRPDDVEVLIDKTTSHDHTVVTIRCRDRKGLLYDVMRCVKECDIQLSYGKVESEGGWTDVDVFLKDSFEGGPILDDDLLQELITRLRKAVAHPICFSLRDVYDGACTELTVTCALDSGGRGRPRVIFDTTSALSELGLAVFMADFLIESGCLFPLTEGPELDPCDRVPVEVHRFLIHDKEGRSLDSAEKKRAAFDRIRAYLKGCQSSADAAIGLRGEEHWTPVLGAREASGCPSPLFTPSKAIPLAGLVSGRKVSYPGLASTEGGSNASSATAPLPPPPGTRQSPMKLIRKSLGWFSSGEGSPMQRPAGGLKPTASSDPLWPPPPPTAGHPDLHKVEGRVGGWAGHLLSALTVKADRSVIDRESGPLGMAGSRASHTESGARPSANGHPSSGSSPGSDRPPPVKGPTSDRKPGGALTTLHASRLRA